MLKSNFQVYVLIFKRRFVAAMFFHSQPSFCSDGLPFVLCSFGCSLFCCLFGSREIHREFKKTTMATAVVSLLSKRFTEQNNGCRCTCVVILSSFLCRPLQDTNVK